ncbi:MAG: TrkA family potassium uptake protein [Desulfuromonadales bacterium]|nr:TrkA family potassium uptake protein [Desulfuromonadales bacterium]
MRILLVGGGPVVYYLAREFIARHHQIAIIAEAVAEAQALSRRLRALVLHGDGSDPRIQEEAGSRRTDAVLALTAHDHDNLAICQVAGEIFGVPRTVVLVNDPENEEVFHRLGVTMAISATSILARLLEERIGFEAIDELFPVAEGKLLIAEVVLRPGAPAVESALSAITLPKVSLIGGIIRDGEVLVPHGPTVLREKDRLIVIAEPEVQEEALQLLTGERP